MAKVTIDFRGMHLFVFDQDPGSGTVTSVHVYGAPGESHGAGHEHVDHVWVAALNARRMKPGSTWKGPLSLAADTDWLLLPGDGPIHIEIAKPTTALAGIDQIVDRGISLAAAGGGQGQVNAKLTALKTRLSLTDGEFQVQKPHSPTLSEFRCQVGAGPKQCLSDHVRWTQVADTGAIVVHVDGRAYPCATDADMHLIFTNYPTTHVHHTRKPPFPLQHVRSLYGYVDVVGDGHDIVVTQDKCVEGGGGGYPVECPYAWARL